LEALLRKVDRIGCISDRAMIAAIVQTSDMSIYSLDRSMFHYANSRQDLDTHQ